VYIQYKCGIAIDRLLNSIGANSGV
jgi:hypothetical protein